MVEKEERIYISKHGENNPCDTCEDTSGEECDFCMENYEWNASITRQEAIERMAKSLFKVDNVLALDIEFEQLTKQKQLTYKVFAEAALNALLEADK